MLPELEMLGLAERVRVVESSRALLLVGQVQ